MPRPCEIRIATAADYAELAEIMFDAVRHGRSKYTELQRQAWVPHVRRGAQWEQRLASQTVLVAERSDQLVGYMSLAANGYIDLAFIRPSAQGTGVFRRLYESIESLAEDNQEPRLWVHASLMAEPAFTAVGFSITKTEYVTIGEESLKRFEMEKNFR